MDMGGHALVTPWMNSFEDNCSIDVCYLISHKNCFAACILGLLQNMYLKFACYKSNLALLSCKQEFELVKFILLLLLPLLMSFTWHWLLSTANTKSTKRKGILICIDLQKVSVLISNRFE